MESLNPRHFILQWLDSDPEMRSTTATLLKAGEVLGFNNNQVRVALSRLLSDGLLENPCRGQYRLSGDGAAIGLEIRHWRSLENKLIAWQGDWCGIVTDNLAAEGSTLFRQQNRALEMRGMKRWKPGLWLRPNNLSGGLEQLSKDLHSLGLDAQRGCCLINAGDSASQQDMQGLWHSDTINQTYQQRIDLILQSIKGFDESDITGALVQAVVLGGDTIRMLLKDPLLPGAMVNSKLRQLLIQTMMDYEDIGRHHWLQFIEEIKH